jgi:uncharacterized protein (DUF1697 family)
VSVQIALFRGINVGKAKRIAMADLRTMFESLGFASVRTLLNSGNVVFDAGRSTATANAKRIADALIEHTGIAANTVVLTAKDLDAAIAENPFTARIDDPSRMLLGFMTAGADRGPLKALVDGAAKDEAVALIARTLYLWCPHGILESKVAETLVGPKCQHLVTTRNWATVRKLQTIAAG